MFRHETGSWQLINGTCSWKLYILLYLTQGPIFDSGTNIWLSDQYLSQGPIFWCDYKFNRLNATIAFLLFFSQMQHSDHYTVNNGSSVTIISCSHAVSTIFHNYLSHAVSNIFHMHTFFCKKNAYFNGFDMSSWCISFCCVLSAVILLVFVSE